MTADKIIQDKGFMTFMNDAKNYCSFIEADPGNNYKSFLLSVQQQLMALYSYGKELPEFELADSNVFEETDITDADIRDLLKFIGSRLRDPFYWSVFDPTNHDDTSSVCGDLVDDLGDIYKDIKTFLLGFEDIDEDARQNALWQLKWSFDFHWNDHCIDAIYAIHYFLKHAEDKID